MSENLDGYESKRVDVYGDKFARARKDRKVAYTRYIEKEERTFTCVICKKSVTQWHYPTNLKYCSDECKSEGRRIKTLARVHKSREKVRQRKQEKA